MKKNNVIFLGIVVALGLALVFPTGCTKQETGTEETEMVAGEPQEEMAEVEIPEAVSAAYKPHFPDAEIAKVEVEEKGDLMLFDIEFKDDRGEIEVASDGTIIDIATVITEEDLPPAAADAIRKAAEGATVKRFERSEVHSEVRETDGAFTVVKLESFRYVYEAELVKGDQTGEIEVDGDGNVIEPLKWEGPDPRG